MARVIAVCLILFALGNAALAFHTSITGGYRDGIALGMRLDHHLNEQLILNYGLEASTGEDFTADGDNPLVLFAGGRVQAGQLGWSPVFLGLEGVGNYGINSEIGVSTYILLENLYNREPLYLQIGLDNFYQHSHVIMQLGYTIY